MGTMPPRLSFALSLNRHDATDASLASNSLFAVCAGQHVLLLDARRAAFAEVLAGHTAAVHAARFVPLPLPLPRSGPRAFFAPERELLSCGADATVRVWTRDEAGPGEGSGAGNDAGEREDAGASGNAGARAGGDSIAGAWRCSATLVGHSASATALAVLALPGGAAVAASAAADCSLRVWARGAPGSGAGWAACARLELKSAAVMMAVALTFLPGGSLAQSTGGAAALERVLLAAGGTDLRVHLFLVRAAASESVSDNAGDARLPLELVEVLSLQGHADWVRAVSFSHNSWLQAHFGGAEAHAFVMLSSASQDGKVRLWRISRRSDSSAPAVGCAPIAPDDIDAAFDVDSDAQEAPGSEERGAGLLRLSALSPADFDRMLLLADDAVGGPDAATQKLLRRPSTFEAQVAGGGGAVLFDATFDSVLKGHEGWVFSVRWHPPVAVSGRTPAEQSRLWQPPCLVSAGSDKTICVWSTVRQVLTISATSSLAAASEAAEASAWDGTWEPVARVGSGVGSASLGMFGAVFSSDAALIVAHGFQGALHVWASGDADSSTAASAQQHALRELAFATDFFPPLASAHASQWRAVAAPGGHFRAITDLAWSPDGHYLLSASDDATMRVWAPVLPQDGGPQQWHEVSRPQIHGYEIKAVCAPNTSELAHRFFSGADEKVVRVFDAPELFVSALKAASAAALSRSGYGAVNDDSTTPGAPQRAAFAYVPELGLTNKAVAAAFGSSAADAATKDRFHFDGSDELQRKRDKDGKELRNSFHRAGGGGEDDDDAPSSLALGEARPAPTDKVGASDEGASPTLPEAASLGIQRVPLEESLVQHSRWPETEKLHGHANEIQSLAASSLGRVVASACSARSEEAAEVLLWDARTCRPLQRLRAHKLTVERMEFSPALSRVVLLASAASADASLAASGGGALFGVRACAPTESGGLGAPDSEFLVTAGRDRLVGVFAAARADGGVADGGVADGSCAADAAMPPLRLLQLLPGHTRQVWAISVAPVPDSAAIFGPVGVASGGDNGSTESRCPDTGVRLFATGSRDHSLRLWALRGARAGGAEPAAAGECAMRRFEAAVTALSFAPVCRALPAQGAGGAGRLSLLLAFGLETGALGLVSVVAQRAAENGEWAWRFGRVTQLAPHGGGGGGGVSKVAWRPLTQVADGALLELATAGADGLLAWHAVSIVDLLE